MIVIALVSFFTDSFLSHLFSSFFNISVPSFLNQYDKKSSLGVIYIIFYRKYSSLF